MDKKKLLIIIILIAVGAIFQIMIHDGFGLFNKEMDNKLIDKDLPNNFILKKEQFKSLSIIDLNNFAGDIIVERSDNEISYINTKIIVFHKDKIKAEKIRETITILFEKKEDKLKILSMHKKGFQFDRVRINYNIKLTDRSMLIINNANGIVKVSEIKAPLKITNINGQIKLSKIEGNVFIKEAIENDIAILNCSDITANLVNTATYISNSYGNIDLFSKGGKIKINSINNNKKIRIVSKQSRISLSEIKNNNINIKISYEDIYIKSLSSSVVDLYLKNSNLIIDPITENNIKKISINAIDAKILLKLYGSISPKYIIDLNYGNITGDINKLKITQNDHTQQAISSKGKPEIIIKGEYTDVKIVDKINKR